MIAALANRRRPLRIGHMGAAGLAPGNSLESIDAALQVGIDLIELDVWRTTDDQLVLAHFDWISPHPPSNNGAQGGPHTWLRTARTWRHWPRITRSDLATLRRLPAPPPTLEEALDLMRGRALPYLDLRGAGPAMAARVSAVLRDGAPDGALLGSGPGRSFAPEIAHLPSLVATSGVALPLFGRALSPTSLAAFARHAIRGARRNAAGGLSVEYHLAQPALLEVCRQEGFFVFAWTVDDPTIMARLAALGVDGITTNRPDRLATVLRGTQAVRA